MGPWKFSVDMGVLIIVPSLEVNHYENTPIQYNGIFYGCRNEKFQLITKTRLFKYFENFTTIKIENFQIKNPDIFHISAQNIDCGYSLERLVEGEGRN